MQMGRFISLIVISFFLFIGCGKDENIDSCIDEGAVGGPISVHVSCGDSVSTPIYSWSDGSNDPSATRVMVTPTSPNNAPAVWDVFDASLQDSIHSAVIHGPAPFGSAQQVTAPELDLKIDVWYRVTVTKADPTQSGTREFLIKP